MQASETKKQNNISAGFTMIELLVVIAIIGLLSSVVLVSLNLSRQKARDTQRLANISQVIKALEFYYGKNNQFPAPTCPCGDGGWETSDADASTWIESLNPIFGGAKTPVDPVNRNVAGSSLFGPRPGSYYFGYYRYDPPAYCKCDPSSPTCRNITKPIGIITIRNLEEIVPDDLPLAGMPLPETVNISRAVCGDPGADGICTQAEYIAGQCRDWSQEFDYSAILIE